MNINFFDSVNDPSNKFATFCDHYLYLEGISNRLGYQKYQSNPLIKIHSSPLDWKKTAILIIQIVSFIIFPLLLIMALTGKALNRKFHPHEEMKIIPKAISVHLDIRGSTWLTNYHLMLYSRYLEGQYPDLLVPSLDIDEKALYNGILEKCSPEMFKSGKKNLAFHVQISGNHWTFLFVDISNRTLEFYDSMINYGNHSMLQIYFKYFTHFLSHIYPGNSPFQLINKIDVCLQSDSYQCGPWVLYFLEERMKNPDVNFSFLQNPSTLIATYRSHIQTKIITLLDGLKPSSQAGASLPPAPPVKGGKNPLESP